MLTKVCSKACTRCCVRNDVANSFCSQCGEQFPDNGQLYDGWFKLLAKLASDDDTSIDDATLLLDLIERDDQLPLWDCQTERQREVHNAMIRRLLRDVVDCPQDSFLIEIDTLTDRSEEEA